MRQLNFALLVFTAILLAACAVPAATPTPAPGPITPLPPPPGDSAGTPAPGDVVSATPLPPGLEQPRIPQPYAPAPGDDKLQRGNAFIGPVQINVAESYPPQFFLNITGELPTPCHQLRIRTSAPDGEHRIVVEAYSVIEPNAVCVQVIEPFNVSVPLGSFPAGKYEVWLNGQPVGEIEAP